MSNEQPSIDLGGLGSDQLAEHLEAMGDPSPAEDLIHSVQEIRADGESEDGRVRVVARADGTLAELTIDPRLLRAGSEAVAAAVLEAVNVAATRTRAEITDLLGGSDTRSVARIGENLQRDLAGIIDQVLTDVARVERRLSQVPRKPRRPGSTQGR
ncbi:YbaB/EbfC family nucleoid-associated protein [Actinopolymorpha pittospori]